MLSIRKEARLVSIFWLRKISSLVERWVSLFLSLNGIREGGFVVEVIELIQSISISTSAYFDFDFDCSGDEIAFDCVFIWSDRK